MEILRNNVRIKINKQPAYDWMINERLLFRGYCIHRGALLNIEEIQELFKDCQTLETLEIILKELDGCFCGVLFNESDMFIFTDYIRSFLLLYSNNNQEILISDSIESFSNYQANKDIIDLSNQSLFFVDNSTFYQRIFQIPSATIIHIKGNTITPHKYWEYAYATHKIASRIESKNRLQHVYDSIFELFCKKIGNKQIVVPLSGGHDSRLILFYLCKWLDKGNILTYSYGNESIISQQVANYFDVSFVNIPANHREMMKVYKMNRDAYFDYAGNGASIPCFQEWYCVYYLKINHLINDNAVFLPGFSGDFFAGSRIDYDNIKPTDCSVDTLLEKIVKKHFSDGHILNCTPEIYHYLRKRITSWKSDDIYEIYERFDLEERQSKYIQNAVRTYEFWGYEWMTPLFSKQLCNEWNNVSNDFREKRNLYFEIEKSLNKELFCNVPYHKEYKCKTVIDRISFIIQRILRPYFLHPEFGLISYPKYLACIIRKIPFVGFIRSQYFHYLVLKETHRYF